MKGPLFYSKILLFGEYGIIKDSKGLSIPYNFYNGALKTDGNPSEAAVKSNASLKRFVAYLETISTELVTFDVETLKADVEAGMYFDSSIPQGYGVGSSGALVAAIYYNYAHNRITVLENLTREKLLKLKSIFSAMESFFHGKSSGLDPLNSYLSIPILINSKITLKLPASHRRKPMAKEPYSCWIAVLLAKPHPWLVFLWKKWNRKDSATW